MVIKQKHLIELHIYYFFIVELLIDIFHFPETVRYVLDVNAIFLALLALPKIKEMVKDKAYKVANIYLFLYMFAVISVSLIRLTPVGRVLWATRNNYLYIIFFICCAYTLSVKDFERIMKNCLRFSVFNFICITYEFFVLHLSGDFAGGMFGTKHGCNGMLNIYLFVVTAYAVSMFAKKKLSIYWLIWIVISSLIAAAMSELKFFYVEFLIIIVLYFLLSRVSFRNAYLLIGIVVIFYIAYQIVGAIRPDIIEFFSKVENVTAYSKNTYGNTIINRGTVLSQIHNMFFGNDIKLNLFGYGFGYCEESKSFGWANSPFADRYSFLGYRNLSSAMLLLETGYIGLIGFMAVLILYFIAGQKQKNTENNAFLIFAQLVAILLLINLWYNSTIRNLCAYYSFFALSALIIPVRQKRIEDKKKELEEAGKNKKSYFKKKA